MSDVKALTAAPIPTKSKTYVTEGMPSAVHISYQVTVVSNLMAFGSSPKNVEQFGINLREWRVVGALGKMGPLTAKRLVDLIRQDKANISRAITELSTKNYIIKMPNNAHKKSPFIWLTVEGQALFDTIYPTFTQQAEMFSSILSEQEQTLLCELLDKLKDNTEKVRREQELD